MRTWFIYLMLVPITIVNAAEETHSSKFTLDQAIVNVLERSPLIKAADYESKAAAARIRIAQLSPAYRTSLVVENFAGSGNNSGNNNLESTLSLSKVLELGDKAQLRSELAQGKALALRNEQDAQRLDLLAETTRRFIHVVTDQERLVIAKDSLALAKRTRNVVQQRINTGKAPNAELRRANITVARKELELEHAEHELETSRVKLATLWGQTQVLFVIARADLFAIEPLTPFESLVGSLERNPDLMRYVTEKRLANTRIQLAKSGRQSDIEVTGGIRHFNATDDTALMFSLNVPLGTTSRAAPSIEESEMLSLRDPYLYAQRKLELHATLFEVHQEIRHAIDAVTTLRKTIIPEADSALRDYERGYAVGRYSFLELTEAQRTLLDARLEAVMAATDYHRYRIEIDRLTGAGLSAGDTP